MSLTLGIETSCDETALALVDGGKLIAERIATQIDAHALFGGVVPELASREHLRVLSPLLDELLNEAGVALADVQNIAIARGPGLLGSLLVGMSFAKGLALATGARLVGVNHLWAHLTAPALAEDIQYPALGLLVSGGHTQTYCIRTPLDFQVLGRTLDDAAGEAFDKAAKSFNFPYPGGKYIDILGQLSEPDKKMFPRPYVNNDNLDFSFSGLKTAVVNFVDAHPHLRLPKMPGPGENVQDLLKEAGILDEFAHACASFNWAVADALRIKVDRALTQVKDEGIRSLVVAGGVAANSVIRQTMIEVAKAHKLHCVLPPLNLCTDNGAMIAVLGERLAEAGLRHDLNLEAIPRGRAIPWDYIQD